jgi:hypothetical protein
MTTGATFEGIYVAFLPQGGRALADALREASRQFLGERPHAGWYLEYGLLSAMPGAVAFRLCNEVEPFAWRSAGFVRLASLASAIGPGRCFGLALQRRPGPEPLSWAEGVAFDGGRRVAHEQDLADPAEALAWFGEQLALSENEVLALFGACDQRIGLQAGAERPLDEIDEILDRARREFERYRALRDARERGERG